MYRALVENKKTYKMEPSKLKSHNKQISYCKKATKMGRFCVNIVYKLLIVDEHLMKLT